jgi:adenosylcobinamide-phosphate synthase
MAAGYVADLLLGDPRRGHPVALFGRGAAALERVSYSDRRRGGVLHTGVLLGALGVFGVAVERAARSRGPAWVAAATAATSFIALGGTSLTRTGRLMAGLLKAGDVGAARQLLPSLCGRDPAVLDEAGLTRAELRYVRTPVTLSRTPLRPPTHPPPHLGEHTDEILAGLAGFPPACSPDDERGEHS